MVGGNAPKPPNPFTPGLPVSDPGRFAGRHEQLTQGVRLLTQVSSGNPRHALITGPRGIGKTSLVRAIKAVAEGNHGYLDLVGFPAEARPRTLITASVTATAGSQADLAQTLMHELSRAAGMARGVRIEEAEITALFARVRIRGSDEITNDVVVALCELLERVWQEVRENEAGILLVVDELDRVADEPGRRIGTLLKATAEQLVARGLTSVMFLCAGLEGTVAALREEHGSSPRLFQIVDLPPLTRQEVDDLIRSALLGTGYEVSDDASSLMAELSGGAPDLVQAIGYEAFELADGLIAREIVGRADEVVRASGQFG
jgi:energy-coupling factor transporter ATP-binding protein EcfA2